MGSLRLFAIGIDEVRDLVGAPPETAAALRAIAAAHFGPETPSTPGLLSKLGPLFARAVDAPVIRPDQPTRAEVDALLAGGFVPPERLPAAWNLLEVWLAALAWGTWRTEVDVSVLTEVDFDLARAGVPARYGVRDLLQSGLGIALRPAPGLAAGYCRLAHVLATTEAWRSAEAALTPETAGVIADLRAWLETFATWAIQAPEAHRPEPDLVIVFRAQ